MIDTNLVHEFEALDDRSAGCFFCKRAIVDHDYCPPRVYAAYQRLVASINDVIDHRPLPDDAPEIALTLERHYGLLVKTAADNGDLAEDIARLTGINLDEDDMVGAVGRAAARVRHLAKRARDGERPIQGEPFMPGYRDDE